MGMIYTVFMIEKRPRKWLQISARMLGVMSTRMKALLSLFFLFPLVAFSQQQRVSESELVGFLNSNGYSVLSNGTQDVTIHFQEKEKQWSIRVQGKCATEEKPNCVCVNCESIIMVSESNTGLKILGVVLDG